MVTQRSKRVRPLPTALPLRRFECPQARRKFCKLDEFRAVTLAVDAAEPRRTSNRGRRSFRLPRASIHEAACRLRQQPTQIRCWPSTPSADSASSSTETTRISIRRLVAQLHRDELVGRCGSRWLRRRLILQRIDRRTRRSPRRQGRFRTTPSPNVPPDFAGVLLVIVEILVLQTSCSRSR